jgi:hypothetical protein
MILSAASVPDVGLFVVETVAAGTAKCVLGRVGDTSEVSAPSVTVGREVGTVVSGFGVEADGRAEASAAAMARMMVSSETPP